MFFLHFDAVDITLSEEIVSDTNDWKSKIPNGGTTRPAQAPYVRSLNAVPQTAPNFDDPPWKSPWTALVPRSALLDEPNTKAA